MRSCCCTAQCPACGQCCQVDCGHRRSSTGTWTTTPRVPMPWPSGQITVTPKPLTVEDVRRIIREELARDRESRESS